MEIAVKFTNRALPVAYEVGFEHKDAIKATGARFDGAKKVWILTGAQFKAVKDTIGARKSMVRFTTTRERGLSLRDVTSNFDIYICDTYNTGGDVQLNDTAAMVAAYERSDQEFCELVERTLGWDGVRRISKILAAHKEDAWATAIIEKYRK